MREVERSLREAKERAGFRVVAYSVQRDHVHLLVEAEDHAAALGREVLRHVTSIDPASSGRWFSGWARALPPPPDEPAVAAPRTWLLRVGWRRHGLIDPSEIPGARHR